MQDAVEMDADCDQLLRSADEGPPPPAVLSASSSSGAIAPSTSSTQQGGQLNSEDSGKPIDKVYVDQVVNILIRMAAQAPDAVR
jgi:hypothetical protein